MSTTSQFMLVAIGGATGACTRFLIAEVATRVLQVSALYGTLTANAVGCFLLGVLWAATTIRWPVSDSAILLLGTGFLGALTTFSTFQLEIVRLALERHYFSAVGYLLGSLVLGFACMLGGIELTKAVSGTHGGSVPLSESTSSEKDR